MPANDILVPLLGRTADIEAKLPTSTSALALASSAVSNAVLTTPRIQKLDNLDTPVSGVAIPVPSTTQDSDRWAEPSSIKLPDLGIERVSASRSGVGATGWITFKSVTGAGYITFAVASLSNSGSQTEANGRIRLVIDGTTVIQASAKHLNSGVARGVSLVGIWDFEDGGGGCAHVPFKTGFDVEWHRGSSGTSYSVSATAWLQYFF